MVNNIYNNTFEVGINNDLDIISALYLTNLFDLDSKIGFKFSLYQFNDYNSNIGINLSNINNLNQKIKLFIDASLSNDYNINTFIIGASVISYSNLTNNIDIFIKKSIFYELVNNINYEIAPGIKINLFNKKVEISGSYRIITNIDFTNYFNDEINLKRLNFDFSFNFNLD